MLGALPASAQIVDAQGQYVDTLFHDNVDRTAEDFVIASLLVADPGTVMYSVLGHACIRLQCSTFDMDYCFSYEAEDVSQKVLSFLAGKLMMGLFTIPVQEYCDLYRKDSRGVYEYALNLPTDVKRELWRILDEHVAEEHRLPYDYFHRGCAITIVDFVKETLGETVIEYDRSLYENPRSVKEIWNIHTKNAQWVRFFCYFIGSGKELECPLVGEKQLIIPADLISAWQKAKVNGEYLLESEPTVLVEGKPQINEGWFTPLVLAIILLVLSIINLWVKYPYFDWLMLAAQTIVGCGMIYLIVFSDLCCTDWNWLIIPFNPLPAIFWYWRKHWALPYTVFLTIWCIAMAAISIWGQILVDWSHILIVLAFVMMLSKQSNFSFVDKRRINDNFHKNNSKKYKV